jgi:hypothetical protein
MSNTGTYGNMVIVYLYSHDERRHRKWCVHYSNKDNCCGEINGKCCGSAHCQYYKSNKTTPPSEQDTPRKDDTRIELIALKDITVPDNKRIVLKEEADALIAFCKQNKRFDCQITVGYEYGKYVLKKGYLYYYVAEQLGLIEIYAIIIKTEPEICDVLRKPGTKLIHRITRKLLTVVKASEEYLYVKDEDGKEITLKIEVCVKNDLYRPVDCPERK